jgi:uncharacterized membrane protein
MIYLILGLVLFLGAHFAILRRGFRTDMISKFGSNSWRATIGLCAFAGLVLIAYGFSQYRAHGYIALYEPPLLLRHLALVLNLPVFVLIAAAYLPGRIKTTVKHPMLVAVKFWTVAHLCANGDLGSVILFGSILAWAVIARIAVKRRELIEPPLARDGSFRNDLIAILVGVSAYILVLDKLHLMIIGVQPL